jgi:WD40 repeat protein
MASGSSDNTVRLWDRGGKLRVVCLGHTGMITSVGFSGDGKWLISTALGDRVRIWDLEGNELFRLPAYDNNTEFRASLPEYNLEDLQNTHYAAFIPGTDSFFTITEGGTARIWSMKTPYETFRDRGEYDQLSVRREVEYGIRPFRDLLNSNDIAALAEGAAFYLDSSRLFTEEEKFDSYQKARQLIHKVNRTSSDVDHLLLEIESLARQYMIEENKDTQGEIDRLFRRILETGNTEKLLDAMDFFLDPIYATLYGELLFPIELGYASKTIKLVQEIMDRGVIESQRNDLAINCAVVTEYYRMANQLEDAIYSSKLSFKVDSTYYYAKIFLITSYLLNDQFDSAVSVLDVWKDSVYRFSEDGIYLFKERLRDEFDYIWIDSIHRPNFDKMRALLNE